MEMPTFTPPPMVNENYNEDFALTMNKRMRVPSQIIVGPSNDLMNDPSNMANERARTNAEYMHVPDRICLTGNEKHMGTREPPPEFKLEGTYLGVYDNAAVNKQMISTPPRVLRIEDVAPAEVHKKKSPVALFQAQNSNEQPVDQIRSNDSIFMDADDMDKELVFQRIRRRFLLLDQRLDTLEIELARRNRRDLLMYTIGALFLVFRGLSWFGNRNSW